MTSPTIHIDEPAFPVSGALAAHQFNGMTLRDYFAAHCDVGDVDQLSANIGVALLGRQPPSWSTDPHGCLSWWAEYRSVVRYIEADAMLKERSK